jgi:hypothetical protein
MGVRGKVRSPLAVVLLSIITIGIYAIYWQYALCKESKAYSGSGIGGALGLVFAILIGIVNIFVIPSEVGNLYSGAGREKPMTALTGFWVLLPFIGGIVWTVKVQRRTNEFWESVATV